MSKKPIAWDRLDNAAKIFPSNITKRDTKVFRFSCELTEEIQHDLLQTALDETIEQFPILQSVMRKGVFWNYLEESRLKPVVTEECHPVCRQLYDPNVRSLLFEVTYYQKRINFEVFHALTDGTGAMQFLKALVSRYLCLRYPEKMLPNLDYDASPTQKSEDSFQKYYDPDQEPKGEKPQKYKAYQLRGVKLPEARLGVIEGRMPVKELLAVSRQHNTTMTVLLSAVMIDAIHRQMSLRERNKTVVLAVPVNLRNYFASETARNFFGVVNVAYPFAERSGELSDIIAEVDKQLKAGLAKENLDRIINGYVKIEKNVAVRIVPLPLKNLVLKIAGMLNNTESTAAISNIGRSNIPDQLKPYIRMFSVVCSTDSLQACICSCDNLLTVSFSSAFQSNEVEKHFFRTFAEMGIPVEVASNICEEESDGVTNINPFKPKKTASCATPEQEARNERKKRKRAEKKESQAQKQHSKDAKRQEKERKKQEKTERHSLKSAAKEEKRAKKQVLRNEKRANKENKRKEARNEKV